MRHWRKAQSTLEYALIISVAIAALLAINTYMKRGIQGRLKESTNQIGRQFEPDKFTSSWQSKSQGTTATKEKRDVDTGAITTEITSAETVTQGEKEEWGTAPAQKY